MKKVFLLIFLAMLVCHTGTTPVRAAERESVKAAATTDADRYDRVRQEGFAALYNLDYQQAKKSFTRMTELDPDRPQGYLYLANALWLEKLNAGKRLQTSIYGDDAFFADTKEQIDPKFDREFRALIATSVSKAETRLKADPKSVEDMYVLGAVYGALAGYETTIARAFFAAIKNGGKSIDLHKKVLEIDPNFTDANLTIGMYNYIVGALPGPVKALAAVGGHRGSKKRGIELLKKVAGRGHYAQDDARVMLVALYKKEKKFAEATQELETLAKKYPANYLIKAEYADSLARLGKFDESAPLFASLLADPVTASCRDVIEYQYADALFSQGRNEEALGHFQAVASSRASNTELALLSRLRAGQILDLIGKRPEALAQYKLVLAGKNVFDSHNQAKKFTKAPFSRPKSNAPETEEGQ